MIEPRPEPETRERVLRYADDERIAIDGRIAELEREWNAERVLQANAAALSLAGLALGAFADRRWLGVPAAVLPFLIQHAVRGSCPPLALIRLLGVRSRKEIEEERHALKVVRGDLDDVLPARRTQDLERIVGAIRS